MALRLVDKLLAGYVGFLTLVVAARGGVGQPTWWLVGAHALFGILLLLFARLGPRDRLGQLIHDLYPLILLGGLYTELGLLSLDFGVGRLLEHDRVVQGWEEALFGLQPSYEWIRRSPSVFWSGLLHFAYFTYYPIIYLTPVALLASGRRQGARDVVLATMIAFVACYVVFVFYPVGGPNYAFEHPTGPVRQVWSARLVYGVLDLGSAIGTAFPSSHVAATVAAVATTWSASRRLFAVTVVPAVLLVIATVYCQMHYGVDALAGLAVAALATAAVRASARPRHGDVEPALRTAASSNDLATIMRTTLTSLLAVAGLLAACVPSGPIYLGPPAVILEGSVVALETRAPLADTEVCVFGADTLCVAADAKGEYRAAFFEAVLLEGGAVTVRFRPAGYPIAVAQLDSLLPGRDAIRVDCAISQRMTVSGEPTACLPIRD